MARAVVRAICVVIAVALLGLPASRVVHAANTTSGLFLDGEPGEWISTGNQLAFVAPAFTITTGPASPNHDFVSFGVQGETWGMSIDAPSGQALTGGTSFPALNGIAPPGTGLLNVNGDGRGCTLVDGYVSVLEVSFTAQNVASTFAADFWLECMAATPARLYGSIRYHSSIDIRAITVDRDTIDVGDTVVGTPSTPEVITIDNEGTSAVQFGTPRFEGTGASSFGIVGTPCAVVLPGNQCTVSIRVAAATRGVKHAELVIPDSTYRGERRVPLTTTAYQTTTTTLVISNVDLGNRIGPVATVTVSPNPGAKLAFLAWSGGGGEGDPGSTGGTLDPATGTLGAVPLGIGQGTWKISASFQRQDYFEASSDTIADRFMPQQTWVLFTSNSPSLPSDTANLHVTVNTSFGETLVPGTVEVRDAANALVASGPVGGATTSFDPQICCLPVGDYGYKATYIPGSGAAFSSWATLEHQVRELVPSGIAFLDNGLVWTTATIVPAHVEASISSGTISRMQVSSDGIHWHDHALTTDFDWDLTDPAFENNPGDGRHILYVRWATDVSDWGPAADASIELDRGAPTSSAPTNAMMTSPASTGGSATVSLAWSGTDDRSGIDHYEVGRSTDGGGYSTIASALDVPAISKVLASGHAYRFRVRPVDVAGNTGTWTYGASFKLTGVSQSNTAVRYSGSWVTSTSSAWWGGTARSSFTRGSTVTYRFTGRSIAWVGLKAATRGKAYVYVNGVLKATVDLYSATTKKQVIVWSANYATSATRTITIKVLGTSGRPRVDIDGFIVAS
jgi:hypothetical protein